MSLLVIFVFGLIGLSFVRFKNQQHRLGEETRKIERRLLELRSENASMQVQIRRMTSYDALKRRVKEGMGDLVAIPETAIVRFGEDGLFSTQVSVARADRAEGLMR